jgi:3'-5' exoribonuclease
MRMHAGLKVGERIERVVVVAKKVRRAFTGGTFLLFQFSDKDGSLKGVMWDPSIEVEESVRANDVVRITGEVQEYQGSLQIKVSSMEKLDESEYNPAVFLPASDRDLDDLYQTLLNLIESMESADLRNLLKTIFGNEEFKRSFLRAPAAKGWHHAYIGGLAEHVYDMAQLALRASEIYPEADSDLIIAGVLLHDLGKIQELSVTNHIHYSDTGRLLGHIALGVTILDEYLRGMEDFPADLAMKLKHMILSHHGSLENGSPVLPMTVEALLLHYIDNLDAQVRGALQVLERGGDGNWTEYVRLLDRFIYRGAGDGPHGDGGREN